MLKLPPGRRRRHLAVAGAGATALVLTLVLTLGRTLARRTGVDSRSLTAGALTAGALWPAGTAEFAAARIAPGPHTRTEIIRMAVTSVVIPPVAVAHWLTGWVRWRGARTLEPRTPEPRPLGPRTLVR